MSDPITTSTHAADPWPCDRLESSNPAVSRTPGLGTWLWLHGWGQDRRGLARIAGQFKGAYAHRLYDQPGFGACPMLPAGAGTADYAAALLQQPDVGDGAVLVGHSFGCRVAVQAARQAPDRIRALILIAGAGPRRPRSPLWHMRAYSLKMLGRVAGAADRLGNFGLKDRFRARYGSADYKAAGKLRETFINVVSEDLGPPSAEISCPVLLIYGGRDTETPPVLGDIYMRNMPDARLHVLPGYDHYDILDRGAYQVEALIRAFLTEIQP